MQEGGLVGTILQIIGLLATLLFIWRFYELWGMRGSVIAQANSSTLTDDNALGRILKIAEQDKEAESKGPAEEDISETDEAFRRKEHTLVDKDEFIKFNNPKTLVSIYDLLALYE